MIQKEELIVVIQILNTVANTAILATAVWCFIIKILGLDDLFNAV